MKKKPADPRRKVRALDPAAWKVFTRKAGTMKHRADKRAAQRLRKEMAGEE